MQPMGHAVESTGLIGLHRMASYLMYPLADAAGIRIETAEHGTERIPSDHSRVIG